MVIILVATPEQAWDVILGEQGVLAGVVPQRPPILAVMSTVPAQLLKDIALRLAPTGTRVIDAPVSGGVFRAEQGALTIMTGGNGHDIEAAEPVFACLGKQQFHCGGVGSAQMTKIVNNIICHANVVTSGEAYRLAMDHGLDLAMVARVLDASTGRNYLSADAAGPQAAFASMVRDHASFTALLSILSKDCGIAEDLASCADDAYPAIRALKSVVESLGNETFAHWRRIAGEWPV